MEQPIKNLSQRGSTQEISQPILVAIEAGSPHWAYLLQLAQHLQDFHGITFILGVYGRPIKAAQRREVRRMRGVELQEYRCEPSNEAEGLEQVAHWLRGVAESTAAGIVHIDRPIGPIAFSKAGSFSCVLHLASDPFSRAIALQETPRLPDAEKLRGQIERALIAADVIVVPTRQMVSDLEQHFAFSTPVRVIPFGRDFSQPVVKSQVQSDFILALGAEGDEALNPMAVRTAASDLGWNVRFSSQSSSYRGLGGAPVAAICAMPARYEPTGVAVLEAAAWGSALVLADLPSLREHWEHAALFVDPSDTVSLREILRFLILNPEQRERWSQRASERARYFNAQRMSDAWLEEYRRISPQCLHSPARVRSA